MALLILCLLALPVLGYTNPIENQTTEVIDGGSWNLGGSDLHVGAVTHGNAIRIINDVTWRVETTRLYTLQHAAALSNGMGWTTTSSPFIPTSGPDITEEVPGVDDTNRFYRVQAQPPLSP